MMLLGCLPAMAEEAAQIPAGYQLVAENSEFCLYLLEDTMALIAQSKANGQLLYSTVQNANTGNKTWKGFYQSGIVIEYLEDVKDKPIQADFINNANTIAYEYVDNGFNARVSYTDLGISFDVKVWMDEEGIHVSIPTDSIVETKDQTYMIVKTEQGGEERIDMTKYTKTSEESEFLLTTQDGTVYTLNKTYYVSTKADTVTVKDLAGTNQVTLPLTKELAKPFDVYVKDAAGKDLAIPAESVVAVQKNLYTTGTAKDGSALRIPVEDVVEISEYSYTIASIYVYPFMGHSRAGEGQGYMVIPDGQGAVVGFEDNEGRYPTPYDKQVYGVNIGMEDQFLSEDRVPAEDVIMPVFGMVHTDKEIAVLGVIEQGDIAARIQAYPNGVRNLPFDWVTAKYTLRFVFNQPMGPSAGNVATRTEKRRDVDILQHFLLQSGETADYAGLAVAYRNYLMANNTFAQASDRPFDVQIDFLGIERENYILGKQDVVMTDFDQAETIIDELTALGVKIQAGHTDATYACMEEAVKHGFAGLTHTFNAMPGINHRAPGPVAFGMLNKDICLEAICDFVHLDWPAIAMLWQARGPEGIAMISDSVTTAGLPDGEYVGGNHYVRVEGGRNFTRSGGIAGSWCQMDTGVTNLAHAGLPLEEVIQAASMTPAAYVRMTDQLGSIAPGKMACLAAWDEDIRCLWGFDGKHIEYAH